MLYKAEAVYSNIFTLSKLDSRCTSVLFLFFFFPSKRAIGKFQPSLSRLATLFHSSIFGNSGSWLLYSQQMHGKLKSQCTYNCKQKGSSFDVERLVFGPQIEGGNWTVQVVGQLVKMDSFIVRLCQPEATSFICS